MTAVLNRKMDEKSTVRREKQKKNVKFRDEVVPGTGVADVFIVQSFKNLKNVSQSEEDEGKISCVCAMF